MYVSNTQKFSVVYLEKLNNIECIGSCDGDATCFSQCYRGQAACEADCPCFENCYDGCPCDTFDCEFVCLIPEETLDHREEKISEVTLNLNEGDFIGTRYENANVELFKGVPFAQPPVGELRWKPPMPVKSWDEPLHAGNVTRQCSQLMGTQDSFEYFERNDIVGEDCLTMEIWRPIQHYNTKLPIAVYIHGGAFYFGNSLLIGSHIIQKDLIIVFIQYRLGIFGFMNTWSDDGFTETNGNYGLLDQQLAIEFVKQNAENIGGDPNRITILGESAGSMSVSYQLLSDTCDMISGAIQQSGAAVFDQTNQESNYANDFIEVLTEGFGLSTGGPDYNVAQLRSVSASDILYGDIDIFESGRPNNPYWMPIRNDGVFYKEDAQKKLDDGRVCTSMAYMIGTNSFEGSLIYLDNSSYKPSNITGIFDVLKGKFAKIINVEQV